MITFYWWGQGHAGGFIRRSSRKATLVFYDFDVRVMYVCRSLCSVVEWHSMMGVKLQGNLRLIAIWKRGCIEGGIFCFKGGGGGIFWLISIRKSFYTMKHYGGCEIVRKYNAAGYLEKGVNGGGYFLDWNQSEIVFSLRSIIVLWSHRHQSHKWRHLEIGVLLKGGYLCKFTFWDERQVGYLEKGSSWGKN